MRAQHIVTLLVVTGVQSLFASPATSDEGGQRLRFTADGKGGYAFDTGVLRGTLRQDGKARGLSSVVHIPTGGRLDRGVGIASHYRVFTAGKRYGTAAWTWPGIATLRPDGSVQAAWPEAADRPFEMTVLYRWADPQTLDVETTVTARQDLRGFESFLASYFDEAFPSPCVLADDRGREAGRSFLLGKKSHGDWLMFTSKGDEHHERMIRDGRWALEPHPVAWTILPRLAAPLCFRHGPANELKVILMAPAKDCFAVAMPYEGESHYSLYLSLFGRDLKAGQTATARTRFVVAQNLSEGRVRELYQQYVIQTR
jgi:hypothetical protein